MASLRSCTVAATLARLGRASGKPPSANFAEWPSSHCHFILFTSRKHSRVSLESPQRSLTCVHTTTHPLGRMPQPKTWDSATLSDLLVALITTTSILSEMSASEKEEVVTFMQERGHGTMSWDKIRYVCCSKGPAKLPPLPDAFPSPFSFLIPTTQRLNINVSLHSYFYPQPPHFLLTASSLFENGPKEQPHFPELG